jgi:hypothetical protein
VVASAGESAAADGALALDTGFVFAAVLTSERFVVVAADVDLVGAITAGSEAALCAGWLPLVEVATPADGFVEAGSIVLDGNAAAFVDTGAV